VKRLCITIILVAAIAGLGGCRKKPSSVSKTLTWQRPEVVSESHRLGRVLRKEPYPLAPGVAGTAYKIQYVSSVPDADQSRVAVTGVVVVPSAPPPPGGYPIVSWAHGTTGTGDVCAPSNNPPFAPPGLAELIAAGFVFAATDYYGQDGFEPGAVHPYLVGEIEGRNVLDAARAARRDFGGSDRVVTWGYSQGGHASLWARAIAGDYAPDLDVLGSVAFAPVTSIGTFITPGLTNPALVSFPIEVVKGWATGYREVQFDDVLVPEAADRARLTVQACSGDLGPLPGTPIGGYFRSNPANIRSWNEALELNDAPSVDGAAVFLTHAAPDTLVPVLGSDVYVEHLCAKGAAVEYIRQSQGSHATAYVDLLADALAWTVAREQDKPATSNCAERPWKP
jgi:hypothetical protein